MIEINKEKICEFFNKNKKTICKLVIAFILSLIISVVLEKVFLKKYYPTMALDRMFIITCTLFFISMHFIIPLKSMYDFIYRKRFILAIIILLLLVLLQYSGSSINMYSLYVPSDQAQNTVILGKERSIRSDEWAVNTPLSFSQNVDADGSNLSYFNETIRGTKTDMYTVIHAPVLDILTIGKPFTIGYIFGNSIGLSFWWYGRLIALLLVSFEFCMLITNKNKLVSLGGMLMIALAPAVQWWYSNFLPDILIWGQMAILMINKFLETTKLRTKIISAIAFGISGVSYIFSFYPAWIIPFGYVFGAILIWILIRNRKNYKFSKTDFGIISIVIICMGLLGIRYYSLSHDTLSAVLNTSYPGERFELGGNGIVNTFSYVYNIFSSFKRGIPNPSEVSSMLSYYPIPMIVALIYMIRNKKGKSFIIPLFMVTILLSIWTFIETNETFAKYTLLYMAQAKRASMALGIIQTYLIIYVLGNIKKEDKLLNENIAKIVSVMATIFILHIAIKYAPEGLMGPMVGFGSGLVLLSAAYLLFNCNFDNVKKSVLLFSSISIMAGIAVNPIVKGTDIIYKTNLAKEVQKIVAEDKEAIWILNEAAFPIANYLVANGAKTINSTNYYPNLEMLNTVLGDSIDDEEIKTIYNRYAHISINITKEETSIQIITPDCYVINLNSNKLKELNVEYILSGKDLSNESYENITFNEIYAENNMYIYNIAY